RADGFAPGPGRKRTAEMRAAGIVRHEATVDADDAQASSGKLDVERKPMRELAYAAEGNRLVGGLIERARHMLARIEHTLALAHHRFVLVPQLDVKRAIELADRSFRFVGSPRKVEFDDDAGRLGAARKKPRQDFRSRSGARDGARPVAQTGTIEPHVDLRAFSRRTRQTDLGSPSIVVVREQRDARERLRMQMRKMLPVEHVLPDAFERYRKLVLVDCCRRAHRERPRAASAPA